MNKNEIVRRELLTQAPLQVREAGEAESRVIEGYAITFNQESVVMAYYEGGEVREVIAPEAITRELLDACDIKMTMFHDRQLILARSNKGAGTLSYEIDERGVKFSFEAPNTADGDKALELVRRGDISGCSFAFSTYYTDEQYVSHSATTDADGYTVETYTVRQILGVYDFTLAADPAYPSTSVDVRELLEALKAPAAEQEPEAPKSNNYREQVAEMRAAASRKFTI